MHRSKPSTRASRTGNPGLFRHFLWLLACVFGASAHAATLYVSKTAPGPAHNGASWTTAYTNVQAAVNAANGGDEVWVAKGTYAERVVLSPGVSLYGGFTGAESSRAGRNFRANATVLTAVGAGGSGAVVTIPAGAGLNTVLEGFTVTGGDAGGVAGDNTSPTLRFLLVTKNSGSGITLTHSSGLLTGSVINENTAGSGAGVEASYSSATITSNIIAGNTATNTDGYAGGIRVGGGLHEYQANNTVVNNTIAYNYGAGGGGGLALDSSNGTIANNIVAFNSTGIANAGGNPTQTNNDVYGNSGGDYTYNGLGATSVSVDPLLVRGPFGIVHIQAASPVKDAGDPASVVAGTTDVDNQARVQGGGVDIGADESDGTAPVRRGFYVAPTGNDANDGLSWSNPLLTLQAAVNAASGGEEVWAKAGTYNERVTHKLGVGLYGGFAGNETDRTTRNIRANRTTIAPPATGSGPLVTVPSGSSIATILEGFTLTGGDAQGVFTDYGSPTLRWLTVTNNAAGGVLMNHSAGALLNSVVEGNTASQGAGVEASYSAATIANNVIAGNTATNTDGYAGGIRVGGGLHEYQSNNVLVNNTVVNNVGAGGGGGLALDSSNGTIANNIVAFNSSGIANAGGGPAQRNNDVFGNQGGNYTYNGAGATDVSVDPLLSEDANGIYHIQAASPARDAGSNADVVGSQDIDGQARILNATVDIGADESDGNNPSNTPPVFYVAPNGNDANAGTTWGTAFATLQAAVNKASLQGGEVWVKAGTYHERFSLKQGVSLFGGFAGTETDRTTRNFRANVTTITAQGTAATGAILTVPAGVSVTSVIEGFTFTGGDAGAIYARYASPFIRWNYVTGNTGTAINMANSNGVVANNVITGNTDNAVPGIEASSSDVMIANNVLASNTVTGSNYPFRQGVINMNGSVNRLLNNTIVNNSGGAFAMENASPLVANNVIAFNYYGFGWNGGGTPALSHNDVYGNVNNYAAWSNLQPSAATDIQQDPLLAEDAHYLYHLRPTSPAIDTGDNASVYGGADIDGQARVQHGTVDMGADESDGSTPATSAIVYYVAPNGNDAAAGTTWGTAFQTVQAGINAASQRGGEVWVKAGAYNERVALVEGVSLYGGFAGNETARATRNFRANVTTLDATGTTGTAAIISLPYGIGPSTVIEGFTVTNATNGGLSGDYASPVVRFNVFTGNNGSAIGLTHSYAQVLNNTITGNVAGSGSGIYSGTGTITIANNVIANNTATDSNYAMRVGAIRIADGTATIVNNTIVSNVGGGVALECQGFTLANNIIALNDFGIGWNGGGSVALSHNDVYGNNNTNYVGYANLQPQAATDISVDPLLARDTLGNLHIAPNSPVKDAGDNAAVVAATTDIDAQPRIQNTTVDIGADESDGTTPQNTAPKIYVAPSGSDTLNDGRSWAKPFQHVQAAIDGLSRTGGEVWVKAGTYNERVTLRLGVSIYGGFAGKESDRTARDFRNNITILSATNTTGTDAIITVPSGLGSTTTVEGFTVMDGTNGGLYANSAGPTVRWNIFLDNQGSAVTMNNTNGAILNNLMVGNVAGYGSGIYASNSRLTIANNVIANNTATDNNYAMRVGALRIAGGTANIVNNTITGNVGGGLALECDSFTLANNIVAFNDFGIGWGGGGTVVVDHNDVYGNNNTNYHGYADLQPNATTDISVDPLLVRDIHAVYHIQPTSPCKDAGDNVAITSIPNYLVNNLDIDGQPRIQNGTVDIGADEADGSSYVNTPLLFYVAPNGSDANDGLSWAHPFQHVQTAIEAGARHSGDVWVKAGTYNERVTLRLGVSLYGGFAGNETDRTVRDFRRNVTVLDATGTAPDSPVVTFPAGLGQSTIVEGFTVTGGQSGGMYGTSASPIVRWNIVKGNAGGGITLNNSISPVLNNVITGNTSGSGSGIYASNSRLTIANNVIANNTATDNNYAMRVGALRITGGTATITNNTIVGNVDGGLALECNGFTLANNIIAFNDIGIGWNGGGTVVLDHNDVFGNTSTDYHGYGDLQPSATTDIQQDPLFLDKANGVYKVFPASPVIDAGDSLAVVPGMPDLAGRPRIAGSKADIGAYEHPLTYNAALDYTPTVNPGDGWTYGSKPTRTGAFTTYGHNDTRGGTVAYWDTGASDPSVFENTGNAPVSLYDWTLAPGQLGLKPGPTGQNSVVRWTAPAAGTYKIFGAFSSLNGSLTTSDVAVLQNAISLFSGYVGQNGAGTNTTFNLSATLAAGDTVDFTVGAGNGGNANDSVALDASIAPTTNAAPDTYIVSGPAENGTACSVPVAFGFTGVDDATPTANLAYSYRVDGGAWTAFSSANTALIGGLGTGAHTLEVKARNGFGNEDPTPAIRHFNVDLTVPVITAVAAAPAITQATITWTTDKLATSQVDYGTSAAYSLTAGPDGTLLTSHGMNLTGLAPTTLYHYRVRSTDACGHETVSGDFTFNTLGDTVAPDTAFTSGPNEGDTLCTTPITFTWTGSDNVTPTAGLTYATQIDSGAYSAFSAATTASLTALASGAHTFSVKAKDAAGNVDATPAVRHFTVDTGAPVITNTVTTPDIAQVVVAWTTSKPATSQVEYGPTTAYGSSTTVDNNPVTSHSVAITGLMASTGYHFRIHTMDSCGRETVSPDAIFTTLGDTTAPDTQIVNGPGEGATLCAGTATIVWAGTDNYTPINSLVYSTSLDGGAYSAYSGSTTTMLTGLANGAHTFTVRAKDAAGNVDATPATLHFNVDLTLPTVSNVGGTSTTTGATVTWTTSKPATSQVEYGPTTAYGTSTTVDNSLVTAHSVTIAGLNPSTGYHFRVHSLDSCAHEAVSTDAIFTTLADTTAPETTFTGGPDDGGKACDASVTYTWIGSDDATPVGGLVYSYTLDNAAWSAYAAATTQTFTGLAEGLHWISVRAKDASGNVDASPAVRSFFVDLTAPTLFNIAVSPRDYKATVTWNTSEPATAQVEYGQTTSYGTSSALVSVADGSHRIVLTGLQPLTTYHYRVKSSDGCHPVASPDATFRTTDILKPNFTVTGIQLPTDVKPFDTFSIQWQVQNLGPGDASTTWNDNVYLSASATLDANAVLLGKFNANSTLGESENYSQTQLVQMPAEPAGAYYIIVKADGDNTVAEGTETDNVLAQPINVLRVSDLTATPDQITGNLNVNQPVTGHLTLSNLRTTALTGLKSTTEGASANVTVVTNAPTSIGPGAQISVTYVVTASDESVTTNAPVIHFTTAEGESAKVTLNLTIIPRRPNLIVSPASLNNGMVRGRQTLVEAMITNAGAVTATGLSVSVPSLPWLTLQTPQLIGDIAPGTSAKVGLLLQPDTSLPLGVYNGSIAVNGTNASASIPFSFNCISTAKGDLKLTSEDEYTYFDAAKPNLAGAHVTLKDPYTDAVITEGDTDSTGVFVALGLNEGPYTLEATADKHGTFRGTVSIVAGQQTALKAFLPRQLVTYQWTVVPVDTQDHYVVELEAVFETHVPAPVVTVDPVMVDISTLDFDASGKTVVNYTITNHGLIAANGAGINFGSGPDFTATPQQGQLGSIPALTTLVVPVTIQKTGTQRNRRTGGGCITTGTVIYNYVCGDIHFQTVGVSITNNCPPAYMFGPSGNGGGGYSGYNPYGGGGNGTGSGTGTSTYNGPPTIEMPNLCDPCLQKRLKAIYDCKDIFKESKECRTQYIETEELCAGSELLGPEVGVPVCVVEVLRLVYKCYTAIKDIKECVEKLFVVCDSSSSSLRGSHIRGARDIEQLDLDTLQTQVDRAATHINAFNALTGDPKWMTVAGDQEDVAAAWFDAFGAAADLASDGGQHITAAETATLMALPLPAPITAADATKLINRWNRTVDYYAAGIRTVAGVPAGQSTDFIARDTAGAAFNAAGQAAAANAAAGYTEGITDGIQGAEHVIENDILQPKEAGICARVRIHLDQDVTLTRTGFKATLELINGQGATPLTNVKVNVFALDENQNAIPANVFAVGAPTLSGISDVNGNGTVTGGNTGSATWLILPTRDAAPQVPTRYYIAGTLTYSQDGVPISIPLFPTAILVKPDPLLQFHYFLQKDVYSDDALTPEIEPSEPFSLGLLVDNKGFGTANQMTITSSQPQIVDNQKGLAIDFKIIGSQVNNKVIAPSLQVNLGDIAPQDTATARWLFTSSLAGQFVNYSATFKHIDDLGNARTSLIDSVDIHSLEHIVRVVNPTDDAKPDFLTFEASNVDKVPDTLWNSDGTKSAVTARLDATVDNLVTYGNLVVHLNLAHPNTGFTYIRTDDPGQGLFKLVKATRADGTEITFNDDAWSTQRTIHLDGQAPYKQYRLYIFDKDPAAQYTLTYQPITAAPQPIISSLTPDFLRVNAPAFTMTVLGNNFVNGSTVVWNTDALTTTYVSPTQLFASVAASRLTKPGKVNVTVTNPMAAGGLVSNVSPFTIGVAKTYGDVDGDGVVTMGDAVTLLRMAGGLAKASNLSATDVAPSSSTDPRGYGDGKVTMQDALTVLRLAQVVSKG